MSEPISTRVPAYLAEVREREQAATPGPWEGVVDDHGRGRIDVSVWASVIGYYITETVTSGEKAQADAEFIGSARGAMPRLLAAVEAVLAMTEPPAPGEVQYDLDGPLGFEVSCAAVREVISRALLGDTP